MKGYCDNEEPVVLWNGHIPCKGPSPCYCIKVEIRCVGQKISVNFLACFSSRIPKTSRIERGAEHTSAELILLLLYVLAS